MNPVVVRRALSRSPGFLKVGGHLHPSPRYLQPRHPFLQSGLRLQGRKEGEVPTVLEGFAVVVGEEEWRGLRKGRGLVEKQWAHLVVPELVLPPEHVPYCQPPTGLGVLLEMRVHAPGAHVSDPEGSLNPSKHLQAKPLHSQGFFSKRREEPRKPPPKTGLLGGPIPDLGDSREPKDSLWSAVLE